MTIKIEFVNREDELSYLEKEFSAPGFKFTSIVGRRRVGKTRLIEEFIKNKKNSVYFLVQELNDKEIRISLANRLHRELGLSFLGAPSWGEIFEAIFSASENSRIILVLDEFQRFLNINKAVPSILQEHVDKYGKKSKLFLIVMGSSIGMMHRLFDHASALYGRRTGKLDIGPLKPPHVKSWFLGLPIQRVIEIYSVFGGTPKYLESVDPRLTLVENIENEAVSKKSVLHGEPELLIKTELPDSATYFNILKLISEGKTRPSEIANSMTLRPTSLSYFLNALEKDLGLIKREVPVTEIKPERSKKAIYRMGDNFFRFWFRYIYPYKSDIEIANTKPVVEKIRSEINSFIGESFEGVCSEVLLEINGRDELPFDFTKIGRWWGHYREEGERKELEIDVVALNDQTKEILFAECKWQEGADAEKVLRELKKKATLVEWRKGRREYYAVFAKSFRERIKEENVLLFDLKDLENVWRGRL